MVEFLQNFISGLQIIECFLRENISNDALIAIPAVSVAVLLPTVLFLMERQSAYSIDKNVIIDRVFRFKKLIVSIILCSVVLVLNIRILSIAACIFVLVMTTKALYRTYIWQCEFDLRTSKISFRQKMRLDYLRNAEEKEKIFENWSQVLFDKELGAKNQAGLIDAFMETYIKLLNNSDRFDADNYIRLLINNIDKVYIDNNKVYETILDTSLEFFSEKENSANKNELPFGSHDLFIKLLHVSLSEKNKLVGCDYRFFNGIQKYYSERANNKCSFTKDVLFDLLCELEKGDIDLYDVWHHEFIEGIKVTRELMQDEATKNRTVAIYETLYCYVRNQVRYDSDDKRRGSVLERAVTEILGNCSVIFWFDFVTLFERAFPTEKGKSKYYSMIKSWCQFSRCYGLSERVIVVSRSISPDEIFSTNSKNDIIKELEEKGRSAENEACFLVGILYKWLWNPEECSKMRDTIEEIKSEGRFKGESIEYERLLRLESHLDAIKGFINKETKK